MTPSYSELLLNFLIQVELSQELKDLKKLLMEWTKKRLAIVFVIVGFVLIVPTIVLFSLGGSEYGYEYSTIDSARATKVT